MTTAVGFILNSGARPAPGLVAAIRSSPAGERVPSVRLDPVQDVLEDQGAIPTLDFVTE